MALIEWNQNMPTVVFRMFPYFQYSNRRVCNYLKVAGRTKQATEFNHMTTCAVWFLDLWLVLFPTVTCMDFVLIYGIVI